MNVRTRKISVNQNTAKKNAESLSYPQAFCTILFSDPSSADRTVIIVLICFKSASHTLFMRLSRPLLPRFCIPSLLHQTQIRLPNVRIFSSQNGPSHLWVQLINSLTAVHLHIIMPVPFKQGNKEKTEIHICHNHLIPPMACAASAKPHKPLAQYLLPLAYSSNKYHCRKSPRFSILKQQTIPIILPYRQNRQSPFSSAPESHTTFKPYIRPSSEILRVQNRSLIRLWCI